jgi:LmbE family N-acetylglucosaminyl deacetylase
MRLSPSISRSIVAPLAALMLASGARVARAQERGAAALGDVVAGLGTTARVLVIGAHPDDEDTNLITWLTRGAHVETAYLSLTRGDGGQNLIGNELGPALGVIRTEELLAARRIDGGHQYFTRAYDFGFSKSAEETFKHWPRDSILKDVVTVVRAFRPHVIIAMFTGTPRDGHGHHQVSGILAREAFDAAADSVRFPRAMTSGLGAWTPLKFYRGAYGIADRSKASLVFNVGEYNALLGRSYAEIAAESRSQHLSQGFGIVQNKGARLDYLQLEASRVGVVEPGAREQSMFQGIDVSWSPFRASPTVRNVVSLIDSLEMARAEAGQLLDLIDPARTVPRLSRVLRLAREARARLNCTEQPVPVCGGALGGAGDLALSLNTTIERATRALLQASGVAVEAFADREQVAVSDSVRAIVVVYNQGKTTIQVGDAVAAFGNWPRVSSTAEDPSRTIAADSAWRDTLWVRSDSLSTAPWWLRQRPHGDVFDLPVVMAGGIPTVPQLMLGEDRVRTSFAHVTLTIGEATFPVDVSPIVYRYANPARGEERRPIATVPAVGVLLDQEIAFARAGVPLSRDVTVHLRSGMSAARQATVRLVLPRGLTVDSLTRSVTLAPFSTADAIFHVDGVIPAGEHRLAAVAQSNGKDYATGYVSIEYEHIRPQRLYRDATTRVYAVNASVPSALKVGYIAGVSDNVAPMLEQLGIPVTVLDPLKLGRTDLKQFTTIVVGPRAYGAIPALVANNSHLLDFARRGGTLVIQYGQQEMTRPGILPYSITLSQPADRVTEEDAPVRLIDPASPLLKTPNPIGDADWTGWVQERATYMPSTWDASWHTVVSMNDTGEKPNDAGILVSRVGEGTVVYATVAFFRQLPAGNPGAARLFVNLLAARPGAATRPRLTP